MKFRYLLTALLAITALLANAQAASDPMYMVLAMRNGQHKAVDIQKIDKLTFPNGKMNVQQKDGASEQVVLTEIYSMEFSHSEVGGVKDVAVAKPGIRYNAESAVFSFQGTEGQTFAIYNLKGERVLSFATPEGALTLDISDMARGIYIVSYKGQTLKISK